MIIITLFSSCKIQETGAKTDVYLLHGYISSQAFMLPMKEYFEKKPVNIISCDARGHGWRTFEGKKWEFDKTFKEYYELITQRYNQTGNKAILIGHSMGGSEAVSLGMIHPYVHQAIGVSAIYDKSFITNKANYKTFTQKILLVSRSIKHLQNQTIIYPHSYSACRPEYAQKIFLAHNTNDQVILPEETHKIQEHLCLPDTNVYYYKGSKVFGHRVFTVMPKVDDEFLDRVLRF